MQKAIGSRRMLNMWGKNTRRSRSRENGQKRAGRRLRESGWTLSAYPMLCRITVTAPIGKNPCYWFKRAVVLAIAFLVAFYGTVSNKSDFWERPFSNFLHSINSSCALSTTAVSVNTKPSWHRQDASYSHCRGEEIVAPWLPTSSVMEPGSELTSAVSHSIAFSVR